jgi:hypothetical protein
MSNYHKIVRITKGLTDFDSEEFKEIGKLDTILFEDFLQRYNFQQVIEFLNACVKNFGFNYEANIIAIFYYCLSKTDIDFCILDQFINLGVNLYDPNNIHLRHMLFNAIFGKRKLDVIQYLMDNGFNICTPEMVTLTISYGHTDELQLLISNGAAIDKIETNVMADMLCSHKIYPRMFHYLNDMGLDLMQYADHITYYICSIASNEENYLVYWVDLGYELTEKHLLYAIDYDKVNIVEYLLEYGIRTEQTTVFYESDSESKLLLLLKKYDIPVFVSRDKYRWYHTQLI